MEKIAAASTALFTSLSCISWTGGLAVAAEGIEISADNFPDNNLREAVLRLDDNDDGYLTSEEIVKHSLQITVKAEDGGAAAFNPKG